MGVGPLIALAFVLALLGGTSLAAAQSADDDAAAQRDLGDVIAAIFGGDDDAEADAGRTAEEEEQNETRFLIFPTLGSNPALGVAGGVLATITGYWGDSETTPLSSTLVSASFTTKKQVLIVARSDLYAPNDGWHLTGDWRFYDFVERTHGLGSDQPANTFIDVSYDWYRFHQVVSRPVWGGLEIGVGYHLDARRNIAPRDPPAVLPTALEDPGVESGSSTSSGVSLNLVYDRRDHPLNPERGVLGRVSYAFYRTGLGSELDWDNLQLEGRAYRRLPGRRRQVLSVWGLAWLTRAGEPSYFDLPSVGWDAYGRTGRGYRAGRFRGRDWVYAEAEYRVDLTRNGLLGAAAFVNASRFSDIETNDLQRVVPGGGVGLRIKLDKERRSNLAVDVAWGREGSSGLYLAINEAF